MKKDYQKVLNLRIAKDCENIGDFDQKDCEISGDFS